MKPTIKSFVRWMAAFASVACSFLLFAASVNLPTHGGGNGHNYELDCGNNAVLVGMSGRKGDWLDSLQARCTKLSQGTWTGAVFTTQKAGGTSGRDSFSVTCPRNTAVKGISGSYGWYVNSLHLRCEPLGATGTASTITANGSASGDHSFPLESCPNHKPARGFHGKAGNYVDRAGLVCHSGNTPSAATSSSDPSSSDPCQSVLDEMAQLRRELQAKKNDLEDGSRHRPPSEVRKLEREYRQKIASKQGDYDRCLVRHGLLPDVAATLEGTATITTTNTNAPGPYGGAIHVSLTFLKFDHVSFDVTDFPPIESEPYETPLGTSTTTVTMVGKPSISVVDRNTGHMSITLKLHFHHSLFGESEGQDSDLDLTVSTTNTDPAGSPINQTTRQVTLAGKGTFAAGFLGGSEGTVVMTATLSKLP